MRAFASWLEAISPRHRALRTPVWLEPGAPRLIRAFWEKVGWSDVISPYTMQHQARPERMFADHAALKFVRGWLSSPRIREAWGVNTRGEVEAALRSKLPGRSRFVLSGSNGVSFTDESKRLDDPPVLAMGPEGDPHPSWPSVLRMWMWHTCRNIGEERGGPLEGGPLPADPRAARPFAPVLDAVWTLGDGVWALGTDPQGEEPGPERWERVVYASPERYFAYVRALRDAEIGRHFVHGGCMHRFAVVNAKSLDPERPSFPGFRRYVVHSRHRGLVELDGARIWVDKSEGARGTGIFVEPEQVDVVKAYIERAKLKVYEQSKPMKDPPAFEPTRQEKAAARKLAEQARSAAEGKID